MEDFGRSDFDSPPPPFLTGSEVDGGRSYLPFYSCGLSARSSTRQGRYGRLYLDLFYYSPFPAIVTTILWSL